MHTDKPMDSQIARQSGRQTDIPSSWDKLGDCSGWDGMEWAFGKVQSSRSGEMKEHEMKKGRSLILWGWM